MFNTPLDKKHREKVSGWNACFYGTPAWLLTYTICRSVHTDGKNAYPFEHVLSTCGLADGWLTDTTDDKYHIDEVFLLKFKEKNENCL